MKKLCGAKNGQECISKECVMADIIDVLPFDYQITESESGRLRVEGVFQRADVQNANKRVYPKSIWEKTLTKDEIKESLSNKSFYGELDHPSDGKTKLSRVSHVVTGLWMEDDGVVYGSAEILDTPNGQILQKLFEAGTQVGISSRGSGSVSSSGVVGEDFKLAAFDFVAKPSTPGALPSPANSSSSHRKEDVEYEDANMFEDGIEDFEDDPDFQNFLKSLGPVKDNSDVIVEDYSFEDISHDILSLYKILSEETVDDFNDQTEIYDHILVLENCLHRAVKDSPKYEPMAQNLRSRLNEMTAQLFNLNSGSYELLENDESSEDNNMARDMTSFIKERLQEAEQDIEEQDWTLEDLVEQMEGHSDEEILETAYELGIIDEDDLAEILEANSDDDADDSQELLDAQELAEQLEEAVEVIQELSELVENQESEMAYKYEMALGMLLETIEIHNILVEAVGGEDKAEKLMEHHVQRLENSMGSEDSDDGYDEDYSSSVTEDVDDIEALLTDASGRQDNRITEAARTATAAVKMLNLK